MSRVIDAHRAACDGFARVANRVRPEQWEWPTPCTEWDARELVALCGRDPGWLPPGL